MTQHEAETELLERIAFIADVDYNSITVVVNGIRYTIPVYWAGQE